MRNGQKRAKKRLRITTCAALLMAMLFLCLSGCTQPQLTILTENGASADGMVLYEGQSRQLNPSFNIAGLSWAVADTQIAEITADGTLAAKKAGVTTVTLTAGSLTAATEVQILPGRCVWTIGDSIFDYRDNEANDMVQTIFNSSGYATLHMDNLAGATIQSARNMGIIDHIQSGLYESWETPDLIVIFRGTNDAYFDLNQPNIFDSGQTLEQAIVQVCEYFHNLCPEAKIVWATPIYRADVPQQDLDKVRNALHEICSFYQLEVFDLHLQGTFGKLNYDNHWQLLYDGIHLHDIGASDMIDVFSAYLADLDS